jgi:hypothetical protein
MKAKVNTAALALFAVVATVIAHQLNAHPTVEKYVTEGEIEATHYVGKLGFSCGVEAWSVKTMADSAASQVNLTPQPTNIPHLVALPTSPGQRTSPPQVYQLRGTRLVAYKLEGDSDIHLVLRSTIAPNPTMIAEIPDPACAQSSTQLAAITQARADFVAQVGQPQTSFVNGSWSVTLSGVGFGDFQHGQTGVAPNAVELHPVLAFHRN